MKGSGESKTLRPSMVVYCTRYLAKRVSRVANPAYAHVALWEHT